MAGALRRVMLIFVAAMAGFVGGCISALSVRQSTEAADETVMADYLQLPHHVPSHRGGAAFRFAMAHDVIHERFPRHGPAFFVERNRLTRAKLAKLAKLDANDPDSFPLIDDLGAGLHRLGQSDEAITLLRNKLARQQKMNYAGRILYTSYANLGTFLVHANHDKAAAGNAAARARFREGVGLIRKSVEVNPGAHFGREKWQAAIPEFLLAAMEKRELLKTFDCLGNRLDSDTKRILLRIERTEKGNRYGRAADDSFLSGRLDVSPKYRDATIQLDEPSVWPDLYQVRQQITKVGAEAGWEDVPVPSHRDPVPFDEPMLGIIDMWRQGGGANPHFALAIGETMLRVGQRFIAWTAYERAAQMADQFWSDPAIQQFLRDHCRKRQEQIEDSLRQARTSASQETAESLRSRFDDELAYGKAYQRAYQRYEAEKIAAETSIDDEHFFDAFHAGREPIASPVGTEEWAAMVRGRSEVAYTFNYLLSWGICGAGAAALATALLFRWQDRRAESASRAA